jgi:hypothetical protein
MAAAVSEASDLFDGLQGSGRHYADMCLYLSQIPDSFPLWVPLELRVSFDESLGITIENIATLNSRALLDAVPKIEGRQLVPIMVSVDDDDEVDHQPRVEVLTATQRRVTVPVAPAALALMLGGPLPRPHYRAIILDGLDCISFPMVAIALPSRSSPVGQSGLEPSRASVMQSIAELRPVGHVDVVFTSGTQLTPIRLQVPSRATVDVVGIECTIDLSGKIGGVDRLLADAQQEIAAGSQEPGGRTGAPGRLLQRRTAASELALELIEREASELKDLLEALSKAVQVGVRSRLGLPEAEVAAEWIGPLNDVRSALADWLKSVREGRPRVEGNGRSNTTSRTMEEAVIAAGRLKEILRRQMVLVLPAALDPTTGLLDSGMLREVHRSVPVKVGGLRVPFTTEREPETQGRRSGFILMTLGILMLAMACVDLSWLPSYRVFHWLPNVMALLPSEEEARAGLVIEPLVTLLLVFPAALYTQVFQNRPKTEMGNRAQLGTFAALSVAFVLPTVPAAVLIVTTDLKTFSILATIVAVVITAVGAVVWTLFLPSRLARMRARLVVEQHHALVQHNRGGGHHG